LGLGFRAARGQPLGPPLSHQVGGIVAALKAPTITLGGGLEPQGVMLATILPG
jgi:hypothetical protein